MELCAQIADILRAAPGQTAQIERLSPEQLGLSPEECGLKGSPTRVVNVSVRESGVRQTAWLTKDAACDRLGELLREVKA